VVKYNRVWAMPSEDTFSIAPIYNLISRTLTDGVWIDPFVRNSPFKSQMTFTNDLNPCFPATHHMDALDFLKAMPDKSADGILYDPPYSPRQVTECYQGVGLKVTAEDTQSSFWTKLKREIARIAKDDAIIICCGWNSGGVGKKLGCKLVEVLMVPHGGIHNDTIVTVERMTKQEPDIIDLFGVT